MILGMFGLLYGAKAATQSVALNVDSTPTSAYGKLPLHFEANVGRAFHSEARAAIKALI